MGLLPGAHRNTRTWPPFLRTRGAVAGLGGEFFEKVSDHAPRTEKILYRLLIPQWFSCDP